MDPSWGVLKYALLEAVWLLNDVFSPSDVVKPVPPLELVMVCLGYFEVEYFHSDYVVSLLVMVKNLSVNDMCFFARCGKSDRPNFLLHHHRARREVSLGRPR